MVGSKFAFDGGRSDDDRIRESKETFLRLVCAKGIRFSRTRVVVTLFAVHKKGRKEGRRKEEEELENCI